MELDTAFMQETFNTIWQGVPVTLSLTFLALFLAALPAFYIAVVRLNYPGWGKRLMTLYVSFVRGTPIILQILLLYSLLPSVLNVVLKAAVPDFNVFESVDPFWYAVIIFTLNTIAVLSEVFRSALTSIPEGQMEAGLASGLSEVQVYLHVIIPQALVVALPGICNITVTLIKGTSLAFLMTVKDVMAIGKIAASYGYNYVEAYLDVFVMYIILCSMVQLASNWLEDRVGAYRGQA